MITLPWWVPLLFIAAAYIVGWVSRGSVEACKRHRIEEKRDISQNMPNHTVDIVERRRKELQDRAKV